MLCGLYETMQSKYQLTKKRQPAQKVRSREQGATTKSQTERTRRGSGSTKQSRLVNTRSVASERLKENRISGEETSGLAKPPSFQANINCRSFNSSSWTVRRGRAERETIPK